MKRLKKHKTVMNMVFEDALIAELINRNPVEHVPLPKKDDEETRERVFLTIEEANTMLEAFRGHELQALVYTTLYYGLRRSEVLGLKWDAVDFEKNTLKIQHTVVKNRSVIAKDSTKSVASRRTYPLIPEVREVLLQLKEQQKDNKAMFGSEYDKNDYIFVWPDGHLYRPDYVTRSFKKVLVRNGLPNMRFHDIRHSTASILYDTGWELNRKSYSDISRYCLMKY
ncbi:MAG: site-specific integrase [Clostridia bacterium]|nr:site-specific integrase [Clostridia bacterium]